ncbi:OsmC family protein [Halovulum sp. GXIMD14794]
MTHTMPDLFRIDVAGGAISPARTELRARTHLVATDEPPERGGTDLSASPLETMLSAFLGCTNVITHFVAGKMGVRIEGLEMSLTGHFDTRGVFSKAEVRVPFPVIELRVELDTDADEATLARLRETVAQKCPVSVILREAGCEIRETWVNRVSA